MSSFFTWHIFLEVSKTQNLPRFKYRPTRKIAFVQPPPEVCSRLKPTRHSCDTKKSSPLSWEGTSSTTSCTRGESQGGEGGGGAALRMLPIGGGGSGEAAEGPPPDDPYDGDPPKVTMTATVNHNRLPTTRSSPLNRSAPLVAAFLPVRGECIPALLFSPFPSRVLLHMPRSGIYLFATLTNVTSSNANFGNVTTNLPYFLHIGYIFATLSYVAHPLTAPAYRQHVKRPYYPFLPHVTMTPQVFN
jgi:hypothetical protein